MLCDIPCEDTASYTLPSCRGAKKSYPLQSENLELQNECKAYLDIIPNPATSQTTISYAFPENNSIAIHKRIIRIRDAMGRSLTAIRINEAKGNVILDVSRFARGVYLVEISDNNSRLLTKRMIVYH